MSDTVSVPAQGEYLVRDGKVIEVIESELMEIGTEDRRYSVWVTPEDDED
jgi:hypothetical protein